MYGAAPCAAAAGAVQLLEIAGCLNLSDRAIQTSFAFENLAFAAHEIEVFNIIWVIICQ